MAGKVLDQNMANQKTADGEELRWLEPGTDLTLYGLEKTDTGYQRFDPTDKRLKGTGILNFAEFTAGGRCRFCTDSEKIAVKVRIKDYSLPSIMSLMVCCGFDLYETEESTGEEFFAGGFRPPALIENGEYECLVNLPFAGERKSRYFTLYFPVFAKFHSVKIGVEKNAFCGEGWRYRNDFPVCFYGSSITQGAAASRPGNTYESMISQRYNLDYRNMGFSGNAKGEPQVAQCLSEQNYSVFVYDYDYNAPSPEHLRKTHEPFYRILREAHPEMPVIMVSAIPGIHRRPEETEQREEVILRTYENAKKRGENVYFLSGREIFAGKKSMNYIVDGVHPNDLGYEKMAEKIGELVNRCLKENEDAHEIRGGRR